MPDELEIYRSGADRYQRLVEREDYHGNLLQAIEEKIALRGLEVVELGAGTGRLTFLMAPFVHSLTALDISYPMLSVAGFRFRQSSYAHIRLALADHCCLPLADGCADLVISGWSMCYLAIRDPKVWQTRLETAFSEIKRVLRPKGRILLIETLGTGETLPSVPEKLSNYYNCLESHGFARSWIRTDFRFESQFEAEELTRFFFGDEMLPRLIPDIASPAVFLPECTGFWTA